MEQAMREAIPANGGKIVGSVRHPLATLDFSSYLLQAQGTGAKIIALASGGDATVNAIKQGREFGLDKSGTRLASLLTFLTDVHSLGLDTMQGLQFAVPFYWDMDEKTRAFSKKFEERTGKKPGEAQSGVYSGVLHHLKAVQAAGTKETKAVLAKMRELPVEDAVSRNGKVLPNGRMIHDMFLVQVKKPAESKAPWDYYSLVSTIPADKAFRPLSESACPITKRG
jgi:branched-chain amino acid transport system substrate-binding protein